MAPYYESLARRALDAADTHVAKRDLSVNHTQAVTLGVMAAYVVVIALLWNLPYIRWSLWPFKVSSGSEDYWNERIDSLFTDAGHCFPRVRPCHHRMLHRRPGQVHLSGSP